MIWVDVGPAMMVDVACVTKVNVGQVKKVGVVAVRRVGVVAVRRVGVVAVRRVSVGHGRKGLGYARWGWLWKTEAVVVEWEYPAYLVQMQA